MSTLLHLLLATALIVGMIGLRIISQRERQQDAECGQVGCCRGYNIDEKPGRRISRGA